MGQPDASRTEGRSAVDGRHGALPFRRLAHELSALYEWLPATQRRQFRVVGVLAVVSAVAESLMIALLVPFLAFIAGVPGAGDNFVSASIAEWTGAAPDALFRISAIAVASLVILSAGARYALLSIKIRLVESAAHEIGTQIYAGALGQSYSQFVTRNSSEVIAGAEKVRGLAMGVLTPAIDALTAIVMGAIIGVALIALEPVVALGAAVVLGLLYLAISRASRSRLARNSDILSHAFTQRIKMIQEGLGGIRDVKIGQTETDMADRFRAIDASFRDAKIESGLIAQSPGLFVEAIALAALVAAAAVLAGAPSQAARYLPMIGAFGYGLHRLMPLWQQIYLVRSSFATYSGLLADVRELLAIEPDRAEGAGQAIPALGRSVEFDDVGFTYSGSDTPAVQGISLTIPRGSRIGIMGASGAGKSTLVDLFAGLLMPTHGTIRVDGRVLDKSVRASWQSQIAYVPQAIFLLDDSIAANIAFGSEEALDMDHVRSAAQEAEIADFIASLPNGYATRVGERGVRLSGGQRQRIGLARALYRRAGVLILDEATSALDEDTEARIIASIERFGRDLTILAIAHRPSTLGFCEEVFAIESGALIAGSAPTRISVTRPGVLPLA